MMTLRDDPDRGTGRTTLMMLHAPPHAVFVWCSDFVDYPRRLAQQIGRSDLEIVGPSWLTDRRFAGRNLSGVVVDHAVDLDRRQVEAMIDSFAQVRS